MSLLHHAHWQPFESDAGFPDPQGDRRVLMEEVGRLRRQVHALEDELGHVRAERDHWKTKAEKRRWLH